VAFDTAGLKVAAAVGAETCKSVVNDWFSGHLTVAVAVSSGGLMSLPLFILSGKSYSSNLLDGAPPGSVLGFTREQLAKRTGL